MRRSLLLTLSLTALLAVTGASAAPGPYDETADAKAQIRHALADAKGTKRPVLVVFGANWCGDCKVLDMAFKDGAAAPVIARHFHVVKVDVGRFDRNVDVAEAHRVPLKKGIPAVAVVSPQGEVTYVTQAGELADARKMGDTAIADFFVQLAARSTPR